MKQSPSDTIRCTPASPFQQVSCSTAGLCWTSRYCDASWLLMELTQPAAAPSDCCSAGGDIGGTRGGAAGERLGEGESSRPGDSDGLAEGDAGAEGLRDAGGSDEKSTKPVGEGTFSGGTADCAKAVTVGLGEAAKPLRLPVGGGSAGGCTGPSADWMDARVGDRPTAKGEGSRGSGSDAAVLGSGAAGSAWLGSPGEEVGGGSEL